MAPSHHVLEDHLERLRLLLEQRKAEELEQLLEQIPPGDVPWLLDRLSDEEQERLFQLLSPEEGSDLLEGLSEEQASELLDNLSPSEAAQVLDHMPSDEQADLLGRMSPDRAAEVLQHMDPAEAADARRLAQYAPDTAGGLMISEYLAYPEHWRVGDVLEDLRANRQRYLEYDVQYTYVVDDQQRLVGVLRLRDLVLAELQTPIRELMIPDPLHVRADASLQELRDLFHQHPFRGFPVVDEQGRLVGVVCHEDVEEALEQAAQRTLMKFTGILGGEELRSMPLRLRSLRRLFLLSTNLMMDLVAASVIAVFESTLSQLVALAVFLPIISDMGGNAGFQAVAVSMRELALGLIRPGDFFRVAWKEIQVGLLNGLSLGVLVAGIAWAWKGDPALGLIVGVALALNTVVAVVLGGTVPLVLRRLRVDPALASGPVLTTLTDMCGFFLILWMASRFLLSS